MIMGYKIGEIARFFGIPAETLRSIEQNGLLHPSRQQESAYREYSMSAFAELFEYMKYRQMGFSVKEIRAFSEGQDMQPISEGMKRRVQEIQAKIDSSALLMECIRKHAARAELFEYNNGAYWFEKAPPVYYLNVGTGESDPATYRDTAIATQWRKHVPFVTLEMLAHQQPDAAQPWRSECVFAVEKRYADILGLPMSPEVRFADKRICLNTCIKYPEEGDFLASILPSIQYARTHGCRICGPVECIILRFFSEQDTRMCCAMVQMPVVKTDAAL